MGYSAIRKRCFSKTFKNIQHKPVDTTVFAHQTVVDGWVSQIFQWIGRMICLGDLTNTNNRWHGFGKVPLRVIDLGEVLA